MHIVILVRHSLLLTLLLCCLVFFLLHVHDKRNERTAGLVLLNSRDDGDFRRGKKRVRERKMNAFLDR